MLQVSKMESIGLKSTVAKLILTDLPWGDEAKTKYNTHVNYKPLAEFIGEQFNRVGSLTTTSMAADLGAKRQKRTTIRQEPIVVAMGDATALGKLRDTLDEQQIEVCCSLPF